ncbi:MAG: DNA polymerase III subunit delta [Sporocytophaga sp.]|uniref:DNA polymerase III subunit delta n=1 Tax=Sporocytophaga sp. TaxID=2231183 RepID=UPI001B12333C|nr:DNA polymerase III subunit delta [Sporocytophaga sp.]MBO9700667.1 DNA polymerase III subunit delta [Sporocytophaga sp.]
MAVSPESVIKDLKNGKYAPVYFLQGEEPYFIDTISDYIEKNCLNETEKGFNQTILYGKDVNISTIMQNARKFPMFSDKQVVIVKEAQEISDLGKEAGDKLLDAYIQNPLASTVLVFCHKYKTVDGRKAIGKSLEKHTVFVNSKKLYDNKIPEWVDGYFTDKGFKVNPRAAGMISEYIGNNLSRIANEIDKLLINLKEKVVIDEALVEKYVGISKEYNVFELQNTLVRRDVLKANRILKYFEADPKSNPAIPIIVTLFNFYTKVLMIHAAEDKSEGGLAKLLGVNPFFVKDYIAAAKSYPPQKVINIIHYIRQADLMLKGVDNVSVGEGDILKELVFKILH